jgi:hypothetical protein
MRWTFSKFLFCRDQRMGVSGLPSEARLAALIASTIVSGLCDGAGGNPLLLTIEPADSIVGRLIDAA